MGEGIVQGCSGCGSANLTPNGSQPTWPTDCPKNPTNVSVPCDKLMACMERLTYRDKRTDPVDTNDKDQGVKNRFEEQINGQCGPGTKGWDTHDEQIKGAQDKLLKYVQKYRQACGDQAPIPQEIQDYATKPRPTADDWKGDPNAPVPERCLGKKAPAPQPAPQPAPAPDPQPAPAPDPTPVQPPPTPPPTPAPTPKPSNPDDDGIPAWKIALAVAGVVAVVGAAVVFGPELLAMLTAWIVADGVEAAVAAMIAYLGRQAAT